MLFGEYGMHESSLVVEGGEGGHALHRGPLITPSLLHPHTRRGEQSGRRPLFSYERLGEVSSSPTTENGEW